MNNIINKYRKYDFPIHIAIVIGRIRKIIITALSTKVLRGKLLFYGARFGKNLKADGKVILRCIRRNTIHIGDNFLVNSRFGSNLVGGTNPTVLECVGDGCIEIGNDSGMSFTIISSRIGVKIGSHVKIGGNTRIFDHDYHSLNYLDRRSGSTDKKNCKYSPVVIGDDVFIGTNTIILKGTTIGDRAVIGAGSVISGKIPADEVWAGNPARKLKSLTEINHE